MVAFCSILMGKPVQEQMVVLGDMTLGGVVNPVEDLAGSLQLTMDSGGKRVLLPMASASDIPTVPAEIFPNSKSVSMQIRWMLCIKH